MTRPVDELAQQHKAAKTDAYWNNLVGGDTSEYKQAAIAQLIGRHVKACGQILDVGCGTCEIAFKYQDLFRASTVMCLDYDPKVIELLQEKYRERKVQWVVDDIFALRSRSERFDLVFLLDMLHEIYSFYGRPDRSKEQPVVHELGRQFVEDALDNVLAVTNPGGSLVLTDNVLADDDCRVTVRARHPGASAAVRRFVAEYPSKVMRLTWHGGDCFDLGSRELCTLLTQYNKIKLGHFERWAVERLEVHQYMSCAEYKAFFQSRGCAVHAIVGTPDVVANEWAADFEIVAGRGSMPAKRITLLAQKVI